MSRVVKRGKSARAFSIFAAARPRMLGTLLDLIESSSKLAAVGTADNGEDCLDRLAETKAEIVVIDFALPRISGVKIIEFFASQRPELIFVLAADSANPDFFRSGMLAGARELIVMPMTRSELEFVIERVAQIVGGKKVSRCAVSPALPAVEARLIALGGGKGGVGVSFIAANVSSLLANAEPELKVALVDLNFPAGDLATVLNVEPVKTIQDLISAMPDPDPTLIQSAAYKVGANLDFFAAPNDSDSNRTIGADEVGMFVDALRGAYDLVVVDCGSHVKDTNAALFEVADLILIVLVPDVMSVRGAKRFVDSLERLGISKNHFLTVVNRWGLSNLSPESAAEFIGVAKLEKIPESDSVAGLLDDGRLVSPGDRSELKRGLDQLLMSLKTELSLAERTGVN